MFFHKFLRKTFGESDDARLAGGVGCFGVTGLSARCGEAVASGCGTDEDKGTVSGGPQCRYDGLCQIEGACQVVAEYAIPEFRIHISHGWSGRRVDGGAVNEPRDRAVLLCFLHEADAVFIAADIALYGNAAGLFIFIFLGWCTKIGCDNEIFRGKQFGCGEPDTRGGSGDDDDILHGVS